MPEITVPLPPTPTREIEGTVDSSLPQRALLKFLDQNGDPIGSPLEVPIPFDRITIPATTEAIRVAMQHMLQGVWVDSSPEVITQPSDDPQRARGSDTGGPPGHSEVQVF